MTVFFLVKIFFFTKLKTKTKCYPKLYKFKLQLIVCSRKINMTADLNAYWELSTDIFDLGKYIYIHKIFTKSFSFCSLWL